MSERTSQTVDKQGSGAGVLARLWWMLLGNAVLGLCLILIFECRNGVLCTSDAVFWFTVASLALVRYFDVKFLGGCTAIGAPASMRHWVRYTALLIVCSGLLWALVHATRDLWAGPAR
jgi:hypothetical protein